MFQGLGPNKSMSPRLPHKQSTVGRRKTTKGPQEVQRTERLSGVVRDRDRSLP